MMHLKKSSLNYFLIIFYLSACSTASYQIFDQSDESGEVIVSPDRVLVECEWIQDGDRPDMYGFMIHVLDEENTVFTLARGNTLGKEDCDEHFRKTTRVLKNGKKIYIAGIGNFLKPRRKEYAYTFPGKGVYPGNDRSLDFVAISNENGICFDPFALDSEPCPRKPFPTKPIDFKKF